MSFAIIQKEGLMNRMKKEELKRGKPYPTKTLSEKEWNELINYYEDTTYTERLRASLAPNLRELDRKIAKLKKD